MLRRLGWLLVVVSVAGAVADTAITAQYRDLPSGVVLSQHGWPLVSAAAVGSTVMGALVLWRYPRNAIGWLLGVSGAVTSLSVAAEAYSLWVLDSDGPGSDLVGHLAAWFSIMTGAPTAFTALTLVFLLAPDGRLPSRRWRWVGRAAVLGLALYVAAVLTLPPQDVVIGDNQEYGAVTVALSSLGVLLNAGSLLASAVALVLRLRRSRGVERQQLRWIAASATSIVVALVILLVVQSFDSTAYAATIPLYVAYFFFPVATAVAVLRYRLFDLDLIISRAVLLAGATAFVAAGYVAVVVLVGGNAGGFLPSVLATAVVALAFQPLRAWAVRLADRLAYGRRAVPYEALADFSRRLGESPDPGALLPAVAEAAGQTVAARSVTVRLLLADGASRSAGWPARGGGPDEQRDAPAGAATELPVVDRGERLGELTVVMPPGRALRPGDTALLQDLADQSALAFRNARLTAELARQVDLLDRRAGELDESRRRLITASDAERRRLEGAIAREVLPHLEPLPEALAGLSRQPAGPAGPALAPLLDAATEALEALREITRGVYPAQLARVGLPAALSSHLRRSGSTRLVLGDSVAGQRYDGRVEAAAYFCVTEAVRSLPAPVEVTVDRPATAAGAGPLLRLQVSGCDRDDLPVAYLRDRVEAVGGTVDHRRDGDARAVLEIVLPASPAQPVAADQAASSRSGPNADLVT